MWKSSIINTDPVAIDLERIGSLLEKERKERGLSVTQVSERLGLKRATIEAIESGDLTRLPHEVYVRGYVREYAKLLGLLAEVEVLLRSRKDVEMSKPTGRGEQKPFFTIPLKWRGRVLIFSLLFILAVFLFLEGKRFTTRQEGPREVVSMVSPQNEMEKVREQTLEPKQLLITCHERTWISVIIDGREKKEFMLKPGELIVLSAAQRFDLLIGNAGGIKIFLNGKDLHFSGESGEVKRLSLP